MINCYMYIFLILYILLNNRHTSVESERTTLSHTRNSGRNWSNFYDSHRNYYPSHHVRDKYKSSHRPYSKINSSYREIEKPPKVDLNLISLNIINKRSTDEVEYNFNPITNADIFEVKENNLFKKVTLNETLLWQSKTGKYCDKIIYFKDENGEYRLRVYIYDDPRSDYRPKLSPPVRVPCDLSLIAGEDKITKPEDKTEIKDETKEEQLKEEDIKPKEEEESKTKEEKEKEIKQEIETKEQEKYKEEKTLLKMPKRIPAREETFKISRTRDRKYTDKYKYNKPQKHSYKNYYEYIKPNEHERRHKEYYHNHYRPYKRYYDSMEESDDNYYQPRKRDRRYTNDNYYKFKEFKNKHQDDYYHYYRHTPKRHEYTEIDEFNYDSEYENWYEPQTKHHRTHESDPGAILLLFDDQNTNKKKFDHLENDTSERYEFLPNSKCSRIKVGDHVLWKHKRNEDYPELLNYNKKKQHITIQFPDAKDTFIYADGTWLYQN